MVGSSGAPFTRVNIEVNNLHAVVKLGERKNTQVTFTKKKVSKARKKFCVVFVLKNAGTKEAVATTGIGSITGTNSWAGEISVGTFFGRNNLSTQR